MAEAEAAGLSEVVIRTGNLDSARDFTDVRDVVRAYAASAGAAPEAYNVCSGEATTVRELIEIIERTARIPIRSHEVDPARVRSHDVPEVRGSAGRLAGAGGKRKRWNMSSRLA